MPRDQHGDHTLAYYNAPFEASCHYQDTQASIAFHAMHQLHDEETRFLCADERPAQDLAIQNSPTTQGHDRTSRDFDRAEVECVQL